VLSWPVIKKEFRHILRDIRTLVFILVLPIFLLVAFGYAINLDVRNIGLVVIDEDNSQLSHLFIDAFCQTGYFILVGYLASDTEAEGFIACEKAQLALHLPADFSSNLLTGKRTLVEAIIDGSNPLLGQTALGYLELIAAQFSVRINLKRLIQDKHFQLSSIVEARPWIWFNPELASARFLVPGLVSFILMVTAVISTSLAIVREKEHGSIDQIIISPLSSGHLFLGKTVPYFIIALINTSLVLLAANIFFGISIRGSYLEFLLVTLVFLIGCLALGILISTLVDTQQNAFMVTVFLTVLPSYILSGFVFPIRNMPPIIQAFSYLVPNRYFLAALRCIMVRGGGIKEFGLEFVFLVVFAVLIVSLTIVRLRRLERAKGA